MTRKTKISLGVLVGLLLVVIVQRNVNFSRVPSFKPCKGSADEILIKNKAGSEVKIFKKNGKWVLNKEAIPANQTLVTGLEKKMNDFALSEFVSNKEFYERFDLTDNKAILVTVKGEGKVLREVLIGKKSQAGDQSYVKFPGKTEVYLAGNNLADEFNKNLDSLRDKTVVGCTIDSIDSVSVKGKFTLVRETPGPESPKKDEKNQKDIKAPATLPTPGKWVLEEKPGELDQNKVTGFLNEFVNLQAFAFPDESSVKGIISAGVLCEITIKSLGKNITLSIYGKEKNARDARYLCFSSENPYIALIDSFKAEKFIKSSLSDFIKK
jgi:hypothetical protein